MRYRLYYLFLKPLGYQHDRQHFKFWCYEYLSQFYLFLFWPCPLMFALYAVFSQAYLCPDLLMRYSDLKLVNFAPFQVSLNNF